MKQARKGMSRGLVAVLAFGLSTAVWAESGVALLKRFVQQTARAEGQFVQAVYRQNGGRGEQSEGHFAFERPGKFRWEYAKPYRQLLVGDGKKLWSYDPELQQVTVKTLGDALGATPAAILAGNGDLDKNFTLEDGGRMNELDWAVATPRAADSSFERMKMGFADGRLAAMEIQDNFGQTTVLRFTEFKTNPTLAADLFSFTPPAGVDVVGE
ncbi:outer membrane lipoprotein chaperone LolA [Denitromonas iodatirespirans]|uniref:outer membrane lipoprotein chaperone LolA n=1 Tax=Denitromonas iodatirespirans TaxID=2795389 RepID=UPI001E3334FE|nr:outer membrane lipoprotein chaperone LolA [Denitromonas iodatirespirans]